MHDVAQAAEYLKLSKSTIYALVASGRLAYLDGLICQYLRYFGQNSPHD